MTSYRLSYTLCLATFMLTGCTQEPLNTPTFSLSAYQELETATCNSELHETSTLKAIYNFDFACARTYFNDAGCDFSLDPNGDGKTISSSTLEDMHNDPTGCIKGSRCSGCNDRDTIHSINTCFELATFSYFTENTWADLQHQCPTQSSADQCTIDSVDFSPDEASCAIDLFSTMTCEECLTRFDSRLCEDAFNDASQCQRGATCTGCDDEDSRDDGLSCNEIATYSYMGPTAAAKLLLYIRDNPCSDENVIIEGVSFSLDQAAAVLQIVNQASLEELDTAVGLNRRAATHIVEARPIDSLENLAAVSYVGPSALEKLRDYPSTVDSFQPPIALPLLGLISDLDKTVIPPSDEEFPEHPYPGVAQLYRELDHRNGGVIKDFFYVTARQADMIDGVPGWLEERDIPLGPISTGISGMPWIARPEKVADITTILTDHPETTFVLIGDTSHVDPEVQNDILTQFPDRIAATLVHRVNNVSAHRVESLLVYRNYAEAAVHLVNLGLLSREAGARVLVAAQNEGLQLTDAQLAEMLETEN